MTSLHPNSASVESFKPGMQVRWFIDSANTSPYIGRVTHTVPATVKVWVEWPVGYATQHGPEELLIVPPQEGLSQVDEDDGYSSYEKTLSEKEFGKMGPNKLKERAFKLASRTAGILLVDDTDMASRVASDHTRELFRVACLAKSSLDEGKTGLQAYDAAFAKFAGICSDESIRGQISLVYADKA